jgi:hypothetical protein
MVSGICLTDFHVCWFGWHQVQDAFTHARGGGIALHYFHWDLRRFGLGVGDPACHVISADSTLLEAFATNLGLERVKLSPPRPNRADIWHFDAFAWVLDVLVQTYPPPAEIYGWR